MRVKCIQSQIICIFVTIDITSLIIQFVRDICHGKKEGILSNYTFDAGKKCQCVLEVDGYRDEGLVSVNRALIHAKHARVVPEHPGGSKQVWTHIFLVFVKWSQLFCTQRDSRSCTLFAFCNNRIFTFGLPITSHNQG